MTVYLKRNWPLLSGRALMITAALLCLFWVSMDVTPAPLSSPMGIRSAVSVQVNMVAAPQPVARQPASANAQPVPVAEPSAAEVTSAALFEQPAEPVETPLEQTTEQQEAVLIANNEPSATTTETPPLTEVTEEMVEIEKVTKSDVGNEQQTAIAANHQASGAHQQPVLVEPLFAAPPSPPRYPTIARKRGQQGVVWIDVWLDAQGQQTQTTISQSSGLNVLDESALAAVGSWRFKPHQVNGLAMASRVRIPIEFSLQ
ncbi:energy transducer TonB [Neiella sp. HB171785]|uniref:Energy transducer TonB n=1 Tax=Neiella litorisoli TaxID=2771431 RepID=A0A8J6QJ76_9GAMM|nr:energy transducer TonB [Neiella litorisoli]MBD1391325.1 energy transducer TonB [Neiella litorisoli]